MLPPGTLDLLTVAVIHLVIAVTLAAGLFALRAATRSFAGTARWAVGTLLIGALHISNYLATILPLHPKWTHMAAHAIMLTGLAFLGHGSFAFMGRQRGYRFFLLPAGFVAVSLAARFLPLPVVRGLYFYIACSAGFAALGITLLRFYPYARRIGARITSGVFLFLAVTYAINIVLLFTFDAGNNDTAVRIVQQPATILLTIGIMGWTFGFMLMATTRLAGELAARDIELDRRRNDRLIKTIIDTLPQCIVLKDLEGRYLACNSAFAATLDKTQEELLGTTDADHYPKILADKYRENDKLVAALGTGREVVERGELRGEAVWVDSVKTPVKEADGTVVGVLDIFRDVTDRLAAERALMESEKRYRDLSAELELRIDERTRELREAKRDIELFFDVTLEYLCLMAPDGRILKLSPTWSKELGWREDELVGRHADEFMPPVEKDMFRARIAQLGSGEKMIRTQTRFRRSDGSWVWLSWTCAEVADRKVVIAAAHDVSTRVAAEERLEQARAEAERISQSKTQFISTMSHELRTPLNAVLGYSALLEGIVEDERGKRYLKSIGSSGRALLAIINDLLDLTKAESGRLALEPVPFDPRRLFDELSEMFRFGAEEKGLSLEFHGEESLPRTVLLDPARLRQVLINLVGNAIKFTERGSVSVTLSAEPGAGEALRDDPRSSWKTTLGIEVRDTGIGISEEYRSRLFEPFSQQSAATARKYGGTGLGLAIAKRLLQLMGATIRCDAAEGGGSVFRISIPDVSAAGTGPETIVFLGGTPPSALEPSGRDPAATPEAGAWSSARREDGPQRILVVDDEPENLELAAQVLAGPSVEIATARDAASALELAPKADLVIMDAMMPGMTGFEACRRLAEEDATADIPVILVTAIADPSGRGQGRRAGAADYVTKPFDPDELRMRARTQLELKRARDALARRESEAAKIQAALKEKNAKIEVLAHRLDKQRSTDELTGLPNRPAILSRLREELDRRPDVAVAAAELRGIAAINAAYGFEAGDAAIAECAGRMAAELGTEGRLGRWDGDGFLAVLPGFGGAGAAAAAERLRAAVGGASVETAKGRVFLGLPYVAAAVAAAGADADALVAEAFAALAAARDAEPEPSNAAALG